MSECMYVYVCLCHVHSHASHGSAYFSYYTQCIPMLYRKLFTEQYCFPVLLLWTIIVFREIFCGSSFLIYTLWRHPTSILALNRLALTSIA